MISCDVTRYTLQDVTLECSNTDTLRGGLKDVGLQPGEVIAVLDYLERSRALHTSPYPLPPDLSSPHHGGVPTTTQVLQYPTSNDTQASPHFSNYPTTPPFATSHRLPLHQYSSPSTPPIVPSHPPHPFTPTNPPPRPPPQQYASTPTNVTPHPPPQQYNSTPPTPTHTHQHSLHPTTSTTLPQFTPSYPPSTRLPTPGMGHSM